MGTTAPDLFVAIDRTRPRGLRVQIEDGLRAAIRSGRLAAGAVLPSTRALAADLGVTRKVVVEAYDQLAAEGYLMARRGSGTVVNRAAPRIAVAAGPVRDDVEIDFRPGRPDLSLFPRTAWARATRTALGALPHADLADDDRRGLAVLRRALAEYLGRVRNVEADPDQIVVCSGFGHAFDLAAAALKGLRFAVEDPGYPGPRARLASYDAVPVDADGLDVDALARTGARAVVVTPAHQSPTGVVLSAARRSALIAWAHAVDGYVIEDDYDAEYRYDRRPVGALHGLAPDRVIHCGTTAKTLASGVRLGWAVLPPALLDAALARRAVTDGSTSTVLQATFAAFLAAGDLDRHLRRVRRVYRARRDALVAAIRCEIPEAEPRGVAAGLNVLLALPDGSDELAVARRALDVGVRVYPLAPFRVTSASGPGLVLGYGTVDPGRAARGVRLLAEAIGGVRTPSPARGA
jgi:GntR family transcriptional regulator / MocR family aminotransferase